MRQVKQSEQRGIVYIIISALGYGLMPIFTIYALIKGTHTPSLLFFRFALASSILWIYILLTQKNYKTNFKTLVYIIFICLIGFTVASVTIYSAYEHISGSIATLILFTHPFFVLLLETLVRKKKLRLRKIIAMVIVSIGLILVLFQGDMHLSTKGIVLSFISSIAYAFFCFGLAEKETQKLDGIAITAYMATTTAVTAAIQCFIKGYPLIPLDATSITSGILLAIFSTLIASVAFYEGLSIIGPSSATLISSFEPVFVVFLSAIFLSEIMQLNVLIGGLIIIVGIVVLEYKK
jgi:drug/metabolite transporter (DMT)-like permease